MFGISESLHCAPSTESVYPVNSIFFGHVWIFLIRLYGRNLLHKYARVYGEDLEPDDDRGII